MLQRGKGVGESILKASVRVDQRYECNGFAFCLAMMYLSKVMKSGSSIQAKHFPIVV